MTSHHDNRKFLPRILERFTSTGSDPLLAGHFFLTPLILLHGSQTIALQHPGEALRWMFLHPGAVGATWMLLMTCLLVLFAVLRKTYLAALLTTLPVMALSLVSHYKTLFNGVPLTLSDLAMAKDLFEIAAYAGGRIEVSGQTLFSILLAVAWLATGIFLVHGNRKRASERHADLVHPEASVVQPDASIVHLEASVVQPDVPVQSRARSHLAALGIPLAAAILLLVIVSYPLRASAAISGQKLPSQEERNQAYGYVWGLFVAFSANGTQVEADISEAQLERMRDVLQGGNTPIASSEQSHSSPHGGSPEHAQQDQAQQEQAQPEQAQPAPEPPAPAVRPSIVFLMSESFFDVTRLPNITFSEDPLPNFHRLSEESTNGGFHSNTYSGGTGNVEMEMFTGISGVLLKESETLTSLASDDLYQELPSMVKQLRDAGYRTTAIHAHTNRLFNRSVSFPAIGFEQVLFSDSFPADAERKGGYISDMALAREMVRLFEARPAGEPYFLYGLSMENHQPYTADKFTEPLEIGLESDALEPADLGILASLVQGLMDADRSLGFLLDYFETVDEPVILVFCGDHLPGMYLSKSDTLYTKTGHATTATTLDWAPDELKRMLTTNYAIWTNTDIPLWPDRDESCMLLGLNLLKLANVPLSGFFKWLDENLADTMLLQRPRLFVDAKGNAYSAPPEQYRDTLEMYRLLVHQILYTNPPPE